MPHLAAAQFTLNGNVKAEWQTKACSGACTASEGWHWRVNSVEIHSALFYCMWEPGESVNG